MAMLIATENLVFRMDDERPEQIYQNGRVRAIACSDSVSAIVSDEGMTILSDQTSLHPFPEADRVECVDIVKEDHILIGAEGPHIFQYGGDSVTQIESFAQLDCRENFYTPWGGPASVRSFAHTDDGYLYADIHVGSIMRSPDRGNTWEPVTPDLHEDVHQVITRSADPDTVYANTADAVYISEDRGASWGHRDTGLPYSYGRAIAVHPDDGDCLLASVSRGPHGDADGRLYRSEDRGRTWSHVSAGFPESTTGNIDTFQIAYTNDARCWATVDHDLYVSEDRGETWKILWSSPTPINSLAT
jgi:hypothetical protein